MPHHFLWNYYYFADENNIWLISMFVKISRLPAKITTYLVSIGQLLCLAFIYGWCFLNKISLDWPLTLATQPSISKLCDNPAYPHSKNLQEHFCTWTIFYSVSLFQMLFLHLRCNSKSHPVTVVILQSVVQLQFNHGWRSKKIIINDSFKCFSQ